MCYDYPSLWKKNEHKNKWEKQEKVENKAKNSKILVAKITSKHYEEK